MQGIYFTSALRRELFCVLHSAFQLLTPHFVTFIIHNYFFPLRLKIVRMNIYTPKKLCYTLVVLYPHGGNNNKEVIFMANNKTKTTMTYLERFKTCGRCPVNKYCGTMVSTMRLCNSYRGEEDKQQTEKTK